MTKYRRLVQQNINANSQLNKENEYRSVWTECIGGQEFFIRSKGVDLLTFIYVKVIWQASMGDV